LPETLDPEANPARWIHGYVIGSKKPVWVFPKGLKRLPFDVTLDREKRSALRKSRTPSPGASVAALVGPWAARPASATEAARTVPLARYADVCGQDAAVEAVRDYAELPLKHPELFQKIGVRAGRGILLWGPPGNGKTLLARAVAGESNAHIEVVAGPEVLSKWVGEGERRLREVFQRALHRAPSVVLMDEMDAIAGSRDAADSRHLRQVVSQLLVLLDGLEDRRRVLVIATTNRPQDIDPAILRPGRIDRRIYLGPPDHAGRAALFTKLLAGMPAAGDVRPDRLADLTSGFSGAHVEHIVNEAGLLAVKEALTRQPPSADAELRSEHLRQAIRAVRGASFARPDPLISPREYRHSSPPEISPPAQDRDSLERR
jgi:SpoVK/Ycf46/Vps4 family AAA+-type ATPase